MPHDTTIDLDYPISENGDSAQTLMRRLAPQSANDEEWPLSSALMCHILMLSAVLDRTANRHAEEQGLTFPQWMALGCIGNAGLEGITHSELGQRLMLSKAPITGLVDRLERGGHVRRVGDERDRRISRVVMTPLGEEVWMRVRGSLRAHAQMMCEDLPESEQEQLLVLLSRLLGMVAAQDPTLEKSHIMQCAKKSQRV